MKTNKNFIAVIFILLTVIAPARSKPAGPEKVYYAIEINGVVCGYSESSETLLRQGKKELVQQDTHVFVMLSVLGSEFNSEIKVEALLDPVTRRALYTNTRIDQGNNKLTFEMKVTDNEATLVSSLRNEAKKVALAPGQVIGSDEMFLLLKKEFIQNRAAAASCDILEILEEEVQRTDFKKIGEEKIELAGRTFQALIVEGLNAKTGVKVKYWLAPGYDNFIKYEVNDRNVYLADRRVIDRVKVADMDASIFTKANVAISDVQAITYMKLQVRIEPTGVALASADLDVPGQKFSGTVKENVIDGILEIEHKKYDGHGAPPFPPSWPNDGRLKKYLGPEKFIEADDPALAAKAREITNGAGDSWQAAVRLSKWVADNISYAIPGGRSARKTFEIRAGECGGHSMLLAALCRSAGIPARVVFGAMYAPNFGGGFGQHAWNEIYMGQAGWIPVDATAFESDFVDSGHIRITELLSAVSSSFNGKRISILDYKLGDQGVKASAARDLKPFLGKFANPQGGPTFTVLEKEGNLALDIPGKMVLPFSSPDEKGRWFCKLAPYLYLVFSLDQKGAAAEMALHQVLALPRQAAAEKSGKDITADLAPYPGRYFFAAVNAEFTVFVRDARLVVYDPTDKSSTRLQPPGKDGEWLDEHGRNAYFFEKDGQGRIVAMKIDAADTFRRGELAAGIVEQAIQDKGLEAGLEQYRALKDAGNDGVLFSEPSFNRLGYKYLTAGKVAEAIEIFKLNVRAYPQSFNVYDSLGEAYMKNSQNELAIKNFKRSLQLNPENENARKQLEKLGVH